MSKYPARNDAVLKCQEALFAGKDALNACHGVSVVETEIGNHKTGKADGVAGEGTTSIMSHILIAAQMDAGTKPLSMEINDTTRSIMKGFLAGKDMPDEQIAAIDAGFEAVQNDPKLLAAYNHFNEKQEITAESIKEEIEAEVGTLLLPEQTLPHTPFPQKPLFDGASIQHEGKEYDEFAAKLDMMKTARVLGIDIQSVCLSSRFAAGSTSPTPREGLNPDQMRVDGAYIAALRDSDNLTPAQEKMIKTYDAALAEKYGLAAINEGVAVLRNAVPDRDEASQKVAQQIDAMKKQTEKAGEWLDGAKAKLRDTQMTVEVDGKEHTVTLAGLEEDGSLYYPGTAEMESHTRLLDAAQGKYDEMLAGSEDYQKALHTYNDNMGTLGLHKEGEEAVTENFGRHFTWESFKHSMFESARTPLGSSLYQEMDKNIAEAEQKVTEAEQHVADIQEAANKEYIVVKDPDYKGSAPEDGGQRLAQDGTAIGLTNAVSIAH